MSVINKLFAEARREKRLVLMPFVPAGFPSLAATAAALVALDNVPGVGLIEVGIPFSDPIADGPVIQEAYTAALKTGLKLVEVLAMIKSVTPQIKTPLVAMVSCSVAYRRGIEAFAAEIKSAGFAGLILPDLPPPEAQPVAGKIRAAGLDTVLLIAPSTPPERQKVIAELSSGFIYFLSVAGITGERAALPTELAGRLDQLKKLTDTPICVGFGISKPEHVAALRGHADGAIVGTALVRRMTGDGSPQDIADRCATFCRELLAT